MQAQADDTHTLLDEIRQHAGPRQTDGLSDATLRELAPRYPELCDAIADAVARHRELRDTAADALLRGAEEALAAHAQDGILNFYPNDGVCPYVPLAAAGPWIVTTHGAVLHDSAGYGMLGLGHAPAGPLDSLRRPWVMANVMTPSLSQPRFIARLRAEIGHRRADGCPYGRFVCLNSGSEAVTFAARLADLAARRATDPGGTHAGARVARLTLTGSFHGRTYRPARASHSTRPIYARTLASFRGLDGDLVVVPPNDVASLRAAFARAADEGVFFEAVYLEPVLGEGVPGLALERPFYDAARELSAAMGSVLIVDSIQAGLRAQGVLSIVDYPGFEDATPPDVETWSKALNAGQYPLSVVGMREEIASVYVKGVYGNTMTTAPRALEVGCAVLDAITDELRANIRARGDQLRSGLEALAAEQPDAVRSVTGTGLMVCAELDPERFAVCGRDGLEAWCRRNGIMLIHGGDNGMRYTPHFAVTAREVELMIDVLRQALAARRAAGAKDASR